VELENVKLKTLEEIPVNGVLLSRVRTGQFKTSPVSVARIVMELTRKCVYDITQKGNELAVTFKEKSAAKQPVSKNAFAAVESAPVAPAAESKPVQPVSGDVKIIPPSVEGGKAVPPAASEPKSVQPVPKATAAAASAVEGAKAVPAAAGDARAVPPAAKAPAASGASVKPVEQSREAAPVIPPSKTASPLSAGRGPRDIMATLSTELITLDYPEVGVRDLIGMLAAKAGVNVIYTPDVTGNTSINLTKVPFDEAFRIILNVNGLAAQQVGDNIIRIATPQTFIAEQKKAYQQTRVFFLSYAQAAEMKAQVSAVATAEGRVANCSIDAVNNAIIVTDSAAGLENTGRLIKSLDRVPKQVLIEAKFVEVALNSESVLGVQWFAGAGTPGGVLPMSTGETFRGAEVTIPFLETVYGAFRLGKLMGESMLDGVILSAAQKGKAKVLSDPKITTLNNKEATINITKETPYLTEEWSATTPPVRTIKTVFMSTGISLRVTPSINPDGRILMKVYPSVSQPNNSSAVVGGAPGKDTREADTNVIVKNGETIVIGGLIQDLQSDTVFKVPLLGDIPILGFLFRKKTSSRSRMELLIFVTPRIMED
jgi:type IV pilus assembly protein PilQ